MRFCVIGSGGVVIEASDRMVSVRKGAGALAQHDPESNKSPIYHANDAALTTTGSVRAGATWRSKRAGVALPP